MSAASRCQTPQTQKFPEQLLEKLKFLLTSSTRAAKSVTYDKAVAPLQRPAGATSPRWNLKDSRGAAETRFAGLRCVLCMRPHLQPVFPCLASFLSVRQSVDFVNILRRHAFCGRPFSIPLRSVYSTPANNLYEAGDCLRYSHQGIKTHKLRIRTCLREIRI